MIHTKYQNLGLQHTGACVGGDDGCDPHRGGRRHAQGRHHPPERAPGASTPLSLPLCVPASQPVHSPTHPPHHTTPNTEHQTQFYGKGAGADGQTAAVSADAIREMSGGVPDGVVKGLWAAIRSQAFDNLKVGGGGGPAR